VSRVVPILSTVLEVVGLVVIDVALLSAAGVLVFAFVVGGQMLGIGVMLDDGVRRRVN
jgi:hypothetical protein